MPDYTCARCNGRSSMMGHWSALCRNRTGSLAERMTKHHFCCPGDCELVENVLPRPYSAVRQTEICSSGIPAGAMIGTPCPSCGHSDLVHPGGHNPAIEACLLCMLQIAIDRAGGDSP